MSIGREIVKGTIWQIGGRYASLVIQFVVTIVLSRILEPESFGVIGLLTVFIAISTILVDSGFSTALIRKEKLTEKDLSSVFFFNLFISLALYLLLFVVAPVISRFYKIEELTYYSRYLFLVIPISSLSIVQMVQLQRNLEFKKLSIIQIVSALLSGAIAIVSTYIGMGIMALVVQSLAMNIVKVLLAFVYNKWLPRLYFSFKEIKTILPFSVNLTLTDLVNVIFQNIYTLIIGKISTPTDIGLYNQAKKFSDLSSNTFVEVVKGVSFPALSKIRDNKEEVRSIYARIIQTCIFLVAPLMVYLTLAGKEIFIIVLTEKWIDAVPYFSLLCIYGLTLPLHLINGNLLKIYGDSKNILYIELTRRVLLLLSIFITYHSGVKGLLYGQIFATLPIIISSMMVSGKHIGYSLKEQFKDVYVFYILSIIISPVVYFVAINLNVNIWLSLVLKTALYFTLYAILIFMFKRTAINVLLSVIKIKNENRNINLCARI